MKKVKSEISILSPKASPEHFQQLKFETRETWTGCPNSWSPTYIYSNEKLTNHPHQLNQLKAVDGGQCHASNQHTETLSQDQQQQEDLGAQCWLAKENIEVKEVTKLTNKRWNYKERKTYRWKTSREEVKRETRRITIRAWSFEAKWDLEGSTLRIKKPLKWSISKVPTRAKHRSFFVD